MTAHRLVAPFVAGLLTVALTLSACSSDSSSKASFCKRLNQANADVRNAVQNSKSIENLRTNIKSASLKLSALVEPAPADIRKDLRTISTGFKQVVTTADESATLPDFGQRADQLAPRLTGFGAADKRLSAWQGKNCSSDGQ
jgi:hypothetical protein